MTTHAEIILEYNLRDIVTDDGSVICLRRRRSSIMGWRISISLVIFEEMRRYSLLFLAKNAYRRRCFVAWLHAQRFCSCRLPHLQSSKCRRLQKMLRQGFPSYCWVWSTSRRTITTPRSMTPSESLQKHTRTCIEKSWGTRWCHPLTQIRIMISEEGVQRTCSLPFEFLSCSKPCTIYQRLNAPILENAMSSCFIRRYLLPR